MFEDGKLIDYGTLVLGKKDDIYEDILFFAREKIQELIQTTQTDFIVIEDIQQQKQNVKTYKKLAMLLGVLMSLFQEIKKPCIVVPPTRWKSFCGIKGKKRAEQKANTILFVQEKFGLGDITEDMADAVGIGYWAINHIGDEV